MIPRIVIDVYKGLVSGNFEDERSRCDYIINKVGEDKLKIRIIRKADAYGGCEVEMIWLDSNEKYTIRGLGVGGSVLSLDYALGVARLKGYKEGNFYSFRDELREVLNDPYLR